MIETLHYRKARIEDLAQIVALLIEDELGSTRESQSIVLDQHYIDAFHLIDADTNQYLMVVTRYDEMVATCHLTIMPSLTFVGSTRMQIEAVRVALRYRGHGIGQSMINQAIAYAKSKDVAIIQLTTNKKRQRAKLFYQQLGFRSTHEGMKLYL